MPHEDAARWRSEAGDENPAGPLFTGGNFAESEIAFRSEGKTGPWCSMASWSSRTGQVISCC